MHTINYKKGSNTKHNPLHKDISVSYFDSYIHETKKMPKSVTHRMKEEKILKESNPMMLKLMKNPNELIVSALAKRYPYTVKDLMQSEDQMNDMLNETSKYLYKKSKAY